MSKSLFVLIKTLSKAEKRVFSENLKVTKRMPFYVKLVTYYSKSEVYSPKLDLKIFKSESPKFVSDCKIKCRDLLYDYLVTLEKNRGIKKQVEYKFKIALMLKNRRQFNEARKLLDRIDLLATKYELLEELVEIKTQKIVLSILIAAETNKLDMSQLKTLAQEKSRAIQRFVDIEESKNDSHIALAMWHLKLGAVFRESEEKQLDEDQFKNLSYTLNVHQKHFFEYMGDNNDTLALQEIEKILELVKQNKEIVLAARLLTVGFVNYLFLYIELCIIFNKEIEIESFLKEFDTIPCHSVKHQWEILNYKMLTGCMYALSRNNPRMAIPWIEEGEQYFKSYDYLKIDNSGNTLFRLFIYFALGKWEECLSYIDKVEVLKTSENTRLTFLNVKLICIYEQNNPYYFNSFIDKNIAQKRKNGIKRSNNTNMNDCIFYVLHGISKQSNNIEKLFKNCLENFGIDNWINRYLIHWFASQFPELLNGVDYPIFLEKYTYKHYDFKAIEERIA